MKKEVVIRPVNVFGGWVTAQVTTWYDGRLGQWEQDYDLIGDRKVYPTEKECQEAIDGAEVSTRSE